jgi:hypothetical protein
MREDGILNWCWCNEIKVWVALGSQGDEGVISCESYGTIDPWRYLDGRPTVLKTRAPAGGRYGRTARTRTHAHAHARAHAHAHALVLMW